MAIYRPLFLPTRTSETDHVKAINRAEQRERRKGVTTVVLPAFLDGKGRKQIGDRRLPWGLHNIVKSKELLGKSLYKGFFKMFLPYALKKAIPSLLTQAPSHKNHHTALKNLTVEPLLVKS